MVASVEQLVRTQVLLREVNERIAEVVKAWGDNAAGEFLCECSNEDCEGSFELALLEYKDIRSYPNLFVVLRGHEIAEVDRVIAAQNGFNLVQKTQHVDFVVGSHRDGRRPKGANSR